MTEWHEHVPVTVTRPGHMGPEVANVCERCGEPIARRHTGWELSLDDVFERAIVGRRMLPEGVLLHLECGHSELRRKPTDRKMLYCLDCVEVFIAAYRQLFLARQNNGAGGRTPKPASH